MFGDPFLIVLDEPNANLDADGENALVRAIKIMRHNKSIVIVISHRPSALAALNMAMVLYEGNAIAFGSCAGNLFSRWRSRGPRPRRRTDAKTDAKTIGARSRRAADGNAKALSRAPSCRGQA